MTTTLRVSLSLMVCSSISTFGQETESLSRTVFKMSPQHFTQNALKAGVERFNNGHSGSLTLFVTARLDNNEKVYSYTEGYDGYAGELQFRKYISPMKTRISKRGNVSYQGVYGAGYVQGGSYSGQFIGYNTSYDPGTGLYRYQVQYEYSENVRNWGLGFIIGYQNTLWQVIFLEAFIGGGIQFSDQIRTGLLPSETMYDYIGITHPVYKGILPKIGLNIGLGL